MLMDVKSTTISNGIRVITSSLPTVQSVTFGIWVGVGARYENQTLSGVSHFIEHLLFKGTKKRSAKDISMEIEGYGGYLNAFTQEESTCYYARVACDRLPASLDVLTDMYVNPNFDQVEIDKERGVIIEEIMMYRDQPQQVVQEMLSEALWKGHQLGRPVIGTPKTLAGMDRALIKKFKDSSYLPGNTVAAFAGNLNHEDCVEAVSRLLSKGKKARVPTCKPVTSSVAQSHVVLQKKAIEQTHLAMGIRIFGRHDKRRYALRLLNVILGENMSSRLFQVVREKNGLAYSIHSGAHLFEDSGALVISAGLDRKRTMKAVELIMSELRRLKEKPVSPKELRMAKEYILGQIRLGLESTTHQMMWIGDNLMSYGRFVPPEEVMEQIEGVKAEDIRELSDFILRAPRSSLAMVSPDVGGAGDEERLRTITGRL